MTAQLPGQKNHRPRRAISISSVSSCQRLLFRQPNLTKVYPDSESQQQQQQQQQQRPAQRQHQISLEAARSGTRKLLASFDSSDESAYQSGNSSPAATGSEVASPPATAAAAAAAAAATTPAMAQSPKSALDSLTLQSTPDAAATTTASLGSIDIDEVAATTAAVAAAAGRNVHFSSDCPQTPPLPEQQEPSHHFDIDAHPHPLDCGHSTDEEPEDSVTEAEFRDRLKRLFGLHPRGSDAGSSTASVVDATSTGDLRHHQQTPGATATGAAADLQRARRPSLAARILGRLPGFGGVGGDSETALAAAAAAPAHSGAPGATSATASGRLCRVCGETGCELHSSSADLGWLRRHLLTIGCYKTKEERERAQLLEKNLFARVVTVIVVVIILGLIIGLIILSSSVTSSSSSSSSSSETVSSASTTTVSSGNVTG